MSKSSKSRFIDSSTIEKACSDIDQLPDDELRRMAKWLVDGFQEICVHGDVLFVNGRFLEWTKRVASLVNNYKGCCKVCLMPWHQCLCSHED